MFKIFSIIILISLLACSNQISNSTVQEEIKSIVPLEEIVSGGPPPDGIPSIDNPQFTSIEETTFPDDQEGVFLSINGDSRFYPFNILVWHEIINDVVGGKPVAITFCPLCGSSLVFDRNVNGKLLDFGTSGKLYQSNLVMYDRQTKSLWSQILGQSIVGIYAGTDLTQIHFDILAFSEAKSQPNLKVLSENTGVDRDYRRSPYSAYFESEELMFPVSNMNSKLPAKEFMWVINVNGVQKAYVYDKLMEKESLKDNINGANINISVGNPRKIRVVNEETGEIITGFRAFWFSIYTHNPEIEVWSG